MLTTCQKTFKTWSNPNAPDNERNTPVHFAAEQNNLEILKMLAENKWGEKGDINAVNEYNWSVLHGAASGIINGIKEGRRIDWNVVKWLLERGVNKDCDYQEWLEKKIDLAEPIVKKYGLVRENNLFSLSLRKVN